MNAHSHTHTKLCHHLTFEAYQRSRQFKAKYGILELMGFQALASLSTAIMVEEQWSLRNEIQVPINSPFDSLVENQHLNSTFRPVTGCPPGPSVNPEAITYCTEVSKRFCKIQALVLGVQKAHLAVLSMQARDTIQSISYYIQIGL